MTTERRAFSRRVDDPECRLRLEFSGGVGWRPILRAALDIWVPAPLRGRVADIEQTIVALAADRDDVAVELRQDRDGLRATVGDRDGVREGAGDHVVTRRWVAPPSR